MLKVVHSGALPVLFERVKTRFSEQNVAARLNKGIFGLQFVARYREIIG
jgi:hypothetical protein